MKKGLKRIVALALALCMLTPEATWCKTVDGYTVVSTQKQLDAALKKGGYILIKTNKKATFTVKDNPYEYVRLKVDAPKATIVNKGFLAYCNIIDAQKWVEHVVPVFEPVAGDIGIGVAGNVIAVEDKNSLNVLIADDAICEHIDIRSKGGKITISGKGQLNTVAVSNKSTVNVKTTNKKNITCVDVRANDATVNITGTAEAICRADSKINVKKGAKAGELLFTSDADVNVEKGATVSEISIWENDVQLDLNTKGTVGAVSIWGDSCIDLTGKSTKAIPVTTRQYDGAQLNSSVKVKVDAGCDTTLNLKKGAEDSTASLAIKGVKLNLQNNTTKNVKVTDHKGNVTVIKSGDSI